MKIVRAAERYPIKPVIINHRNLDNRKSQLRHLTPSLQMKNRRIKLPLSGFRGVTIVKRNGKTMYHATININKKHTFLGSFSDVHEACRVYECKCKELYGDIREKVKSENT